MSSYVKMKTIRLPFENTGLPGTPYDYDTTGNERWGTYDVNKFSAAPTERPFVDYVLEYDHDSDYGEYGKVRDLYPSELEAWSPIFKSEMPNCDMNKARIVEFCWYNCSEAPDYYATDGDSDPFFKEVLPDESKSET